MSTNMLPLPVLHIRGSTERDEKKLSSKDYDFMEYIQYQITLEVNSRLWEDMAESNPALCYVEALTAPLAQNLFEAWCSSLHCSSGSTYYTLAEGLHPAFSDLKKWPIISVFANWKKIFSIKQSEFVHTVMEIYRNIPHPERTYHQYNLGNGIRVGFRKD